jgi:hypothetical protein
MVGCGNVGTQAVLLKSNGSLIKTIPGLGGTDELWFDPTTKKFYVTGNNGTNSTRFFAVAKTAPFCRPSCCRRPQVRIRSR